MYIENYSQNQNGCFPLADFLELGHGDIWWIFPDWHKHFETGIGSGGLKDLCSSLCLLSSAPTLTPVLSHASSVLIGSGLRNKSQFLFRLKDVSNWSFKLRLVSYLEGSWMLLWQSRSFIYPYRVLNKIRETEK